MIFSEKRFPPCAMRPCRVADHALYRRSSPPSAPRTSARPTEPPTEPPTDFAEIGDDAADHLVGDGARDVSRNQLTGRRPATPYIGGCRISPRRSNRLSGFRRHHHRSIHRRGRAGDALLQHLIEPDRRRCRQCRIALHRAVVHGLALLQRDRSDPRRWRPDR